MTAKEGSIISWNYKNITYYARVQIISEDGDCGVYVIYDGLGLQQDYIPQKDIIRVYEAL
jgi:hypothetical protein